MIFDENFLYNYWFPLKLISHFWICFIWFCRKEFQFRPFLNIIFSGCYLVFYWKLSSFSHILSCLSTVRLTVLFFLPEIKSLDFTLGCRLFLRWIPHKNSQDGWCGVMMSSICYFKLLLKYELILFIDTKYVI